jgi:hypothetical protein
VERERDCRCGRGWKLVCDVGWFPRPGFACESEDETNDWDEGEYINFLILRNMVISFDQQFMLSTER